jgi:hypothetical protein
MCVGQLLNRVAVDEVPKQDVVSQKGRSALLQLADQMLENGGMDRADEFHAYVVGPDPADVCLDRVDRVELDPDRFIEARALHEFEPATFGRDVVDIDPVVALATAPELNLRLQRNSGITPWKLWTLGALFGFTGH